MLQDFRDFISRGNVVDLAVAVIIGAAFGRITSSLVDQVVMPPIGLLIGGVDFSELGFVLADRHAYASVSEAVAAGAPVIQLGAFLNTVINFLLIALTVFLFVRGYNHLLARARRSEREAAAQAAAAQAPAAQAPAATPEPPTEVLLLTEIRDLLAHRQ